MRDGLYVSLGRISRQGRSCLKSGDACVSVTRVDGPRVSYDDANRASYWVPEVDADMDLSAHCMVSSDDVCSNEECYEAAKIILLHTTW
jgi:hypothetical protein